jgi:hypothetical protein
MAETMDVGGQQKCAYAQCECQVSTLETYCSDYCSDADDDQEIEIQCDCKHAPCSLTEGDPLQTTIAEQE